MKCEISVRDHGRLITLDYHGLLAFHGGGAVAGATIGFRAVQAAASELARHGEVLDRESVAVISGHPGPGYRDAFEYALCSLSRDRFTLDRKLPQGRHSPFHDYAFQFIFVEQTFGKEVSVTLRTDILPKRFFEVLRDLKGQENNFALSQELDDLKRIVARSVLVTRLQRLFDTEITTLTSR